jgi:hypothetical protein
MTQQPFHSFGYGVIRAAVWRNENDDPGKGIRFNVTFERGYKDKDNKWQSSNSFGRDDLLVLCELAREAFQYIHSQQEIERTRARAHGDEAAANGNAREVQNQR